MTLSLRPFEPGDIDGVDALHGAVAWPQRGEAGWRWLFDNPARLEAGADAGWVVQDDADGRLLGFTGNFVQRFVRGDTVTHGATAFSVIVLPQARGWSRQLLGAFSGQPGMFATYLFNANARSSPLYRRHGLRPWPPETHRTKLSWRVDSDALARGLLLRKVEAAAPRLFDGGREWLMNQRLASAAELKLTPGVERLEGFGPETGYRDFWKTLSSQGLWACRGPLTLAWRLSDPKLTLPPLALAYRRDGRITGFVLAILGKGSTIEAPFLEIIDLLALDGEREAVPALLETLVRNARRLGAAKVRIQTVSPRLLGQLGRWRDTAREEGGWGHGHARFAPEWEAIARTDWSPTPFDGDYSFATRPAPVEPRGA